MKPLLEVIVIFNRNEIIEQILSLTQLIDNELVCNQMVSNKSDQILVYSDFCQTIRFIKELNSCLNYRLKVFNNLNAQHFKRTRISICDECNNTDRNDQDDVHIIRVVVQLKSIDHYLYIDKKWNKRILNLVVIRFRMEDSLSWLSTLGGAYSSLGEYNIRCAQKAGEISITQLRLAAITGDPNMIARCGIYMAYSLCQQQRRGDAIQMVKRSLYPLISKTPNCDKIVISMYSALCYRIKHFYKTLNKLYEH